MTKDSAVSKLMEGKVLALMAAGKVKGFKPHKVQVSVRLPVAVVVNLDVIAEALGESRTGFAAELLQAAILDASRSFGIPSVDSEEWFLEYGSRMRDYGAEVEDFTDAELAELEEQG